MKGLLLKDLLSLRKNMRTVFLILFVMSMFSIFSQDISVVKGILSVFSVIIVMSSFSFDDYTHWNSYAVAMPFTRKQIVLSKYILAISFNAVATVLGLLLTVFIGFLAKDVTVNLQEELMVSFVLFVTMTFLIAAVLPLLYKFGTERSRYFFLLIGFGPVAIVALLKSMGVPMPTEAQLKPFAILLPILVGIGLFVSYFLSVRIFCNKDL